MNPPSEPLDLFGFSAPPPERPSPARKTKTKRAAKTTSIEPSLSLPSVVEEKKKTPVDAVEDETPTPAVAVADRPWSVSQLVGMAAELLESSFPEILLEGEVSNLRRVGSGHCYFTLKDESAQISAVLFRGRPVHGPFEDGVKVRAKGRVSIYPQQGRFQMIVEEIAPCGEGDWRARFEALRAKLTSEGVLDPARKQKLPGYPEKIVIVSSPTGAALQDMLHIFRRRAPQVQIYLYPVQVQGDAASDQIAKALDQLSRWVEQEDLLPDLILLARGGGSIEDLWCFNEEIVARAIASCPVPIITGIGHETDVTIADLVADLRAPTPSAAAESAVRDRAEILQQLEGIYDSLAKRSQRILVHRREHLRLCARALSPQRVRRDLENSAQRLDQMREGVVKTAYRAIEKKKSDLVAQRRALVAAPATFLQMCHSRYERSRQRLVTAWLPQSARFRQRLGWMRKRLSPALVRHVLAPKEISLQHLQKRLDLLHPQQILKRGYALVRDAEGRPIASTTKTDSGQPIQIEWQDGKVEAKVI